MENELDIPIFQRIYTLYKELHLIRPSVVKQDRFTIWQKVESASLDMMEHTLLAIELRQEEKLTPLRTVSTKLNVTRFLIRLSYDVKAIDQKKYIRLQKLIDEIGRMLGGWIKSLQEPRR